MNHSKENNKKIQYVNEFVQNLVMVDPTTHVYQIVYNENHNDDTKVIQYFIMYGLGLCIKLDSYVAHMLYAWSLSHNTSVPISIKKNKYFLSLKTNTYVFSWGAENSNKTRT